MANMLVPLDFSDVTARVVAEATRLAQSLKMAVTLIHVAQAESDFVGFEVGPKYIRDDMAEDLREDHAKLHEVQQALTADGLEATAMMVPGAPAEKLAEEMARLAPDMVVIGSHGHGALHQLLAGSACQAVLKHATCPVLVVPAGADG